jgi:Putative Flp pilus-assembly TadE/G-like
MSGPRYVRSERGAVLVQVAIALVGLMALSAFVIDYGVLWVSRRQAQNAADAAAMAGAISLAYVDMEDSALARQSALDVAARNMVWGQSPDVTPADVIVPYPCPPSNGVFPEGGTCIRVNVFRNQRAGGSPLPTFFGNLVGVNDQGVRATATARVLFGGSTNCLLPFAIPDKWLEIWPEPHAWSDNDRFNLYTDSNPPVLLQNPDVYRPPAGNDPGTGFTHESLDQETGGDYGLQMRLRQGSPSEARDYAAAGWYRPVRLDEGQEGLPDLLDAILGCSQSVVGSGDQITTENGQMSTNRIVTTVTEVVDRDPDAYWDPNMNGGRGGVAGGCMEAGTCGLSPRIRPVPVYDPYDWTLRNGQGAGQFPLQITKVIGFFIERPIGNELVGRVMQYPSSVYEAGTGPEGSNFIVTITLVR